MAAVEVPDELIGLGPGEDAVDLPSSEATMRRAGLQISVGETCDFEFEATAPVELTLEACSQTTPDA